MQRKKKHHKQKNRFFYIYLSLALILLLGALVFAVSYNYGYRIKGLSIQKTSTLAMTVSEPGAFIFIKEELVHQTRGDFESLTIPDIEPEKQLITVIKNEYFPWSKRILVSSDTKLTLYPFILRQDLQAKQLTQRDQNYQEVVRQFQNTYANPHTTYETPNHTITATSTGISINCIEKQCAIPTIKTEEPASEVYPFLKNPNVAIYSTPTQLWVSELVAETRIAYEIFEGTNIRFFAKDKNIFIQSAGLYYQINL